ncbi:MAG TPA: tetratricopeptide repeat protein [Thermodesulfobacteriota bacterium]|nr:tetratricopeptide repeat protein [Thermodesulfobacteriota bacterium]
MPAKKISRKKLLKEPDEFISTTARTIEFFRTYQRQILRSAIIVLIVVAAAAGGFYYLRGQEGKALAIQDQALKLYQEAYRSSLENPGAEKKEDFKKALEKFQEALSAYKWGRTAQISDLYLGNCYFSLKEYDQAQTAYSRCLEGPFRPIALNGLAYSCEAKGDYNKALDYFQKGSDSRDNPFQLESMLGTARCFEALNQRPKALEAYQKALSQFSQSTMSEFLRWKVNELKG